MKRFNTLVETKEFMNGVLYRVGNVIRAHRYLPDNVSTLEYLYMAMAEYIDPKSSARDHLCDEFPLPDLMRAITKMSAEDILGVAAICKAFRMKPVKRGDIDWNFNIDHGCRYAETIRVEYYNVLHETVVTALKSINGDHPYYDIDGDRAEINLHDVLDKISVDIWTPEFVSKDRKSTTVMVQYTICPFTGASDCIDKIYEGNYTTGFYVGMMYPVIDVINPGMIKLITTPIPDITQAYECVRTARSYIDNVICRRVNHESWIHGFSDVFPLTMRNITDELDDDLMTGGSFLFTRSNAAYKCDKLRDYSYYDFLSDVFLYAEPDVWIIGLIYILMTTEVSRGDADYREPYKIDRMNKSDVAYCSKWWDKSCHVFKHSKSVLWLLAKLDINTPVRARDFSGWVNLHQRRYEFTKKFTGSF